MQLRATLRTEKFKSISHKCAFLWVVFWLYLVAGACMFSFLEYDAREEEIDDAVQELEAERRSVLEVLWAHTLSKSEHEWMELANRKLDIYERELADKLADGIDLNEVDEDGEDDEDNPWDLWGSLFFAFTSVTTIGYGNICPETSLGRIFTIIYATVGVPICLIYLAEVGKLLTLILKGLLKKSPAPPAEGSEDDSYYSYGATEEVEDTEDFDFTLPVACGATLAFMMLGALFFDLMEEDWDFIDAVYFCFITASTLGFGDLLPDGAIETLLMMLYNQAALSLCAMCFTVLQAKLELRLQSRYEHVAEWFTEKQNADGFVGNLVRLFSGKAKEE